MREKQFAAGSSDFKARSRQSEKYFRSTAINIDDEIYEVAITWATPAPIVSWVRRAACVARQHLLGCLQWRGLIVARITFNHLPPLSIQPLINKAKKNSAPGFLPSSYWSSVCWRFTLRSGWNTTPRGTIEHLVKSGRRRRYERNSDLRCCPVWWLKTQIFSPFTNEYPFVGITHVGFNHKS